MTSWRACPSLSEPLNSSSAPAGASQHMSRTKDAYGFKPGEIRYFVELYLADPTVALEYVPGTFEH